MAVRSLGDPHQRPYDLPPYDGGEEERLISVGSSRFIFRTGLSNWQFTEVLAGLNAGDAVVTSAERKGLAAGVPAVVER